MNRQRPLVIRPLRARPAKASAWWLLGGVVLVAALAVQGAVAWLQWRDHQSGLFTEGLHKGDLISVMLKGGQIYYGEFEASDAHAVQLKNVFYVQTLTNPATQQVSNRLLNRKKNDWHAPESMTIALAEMVMIEAVGSQSKLAQLVKTDLQAPPPPAQP